MKVFAIVLFAAILLCSCAPSESRGKYNTTASGNWYDNYKLVSHAMGSVEGIPYTNSKEAFLYNYERGIRVFEVDLIRAADGILVARHDWYKSSYDNLKQKYPGYIAPSVDSETFRATKIMSKYTALSIDDIANLMREYTDFYIVTDTKDKDMEQYKFAINQIRDTLRNEPELVRRIIPQAYDYDTYEWVSGLGVFDDVILTLYQMEHDHEKIVEYCVEKGINVVCMYYGAYTDIFGAMYNAKGIKIYLHTLNEPNDIIKYKGEGAYGFYTDLLNPVDNENLEEYLDYEVN